MFGVTMYRVLGENRQVKERRRLARHPSKVCPELVATAPQQVYCWDITKLAGPVKGTYFDAYVMIDIYSRYIVGVHVHAHESGILAKELMEQIFKVHGVPQVVHADRGTSMTSKTVAALLADLEVTRSHSRPRVSNDNPYSESLFKTLKYGPQFPESFGSLCGGKAIHGHLHASGTTTSIVTPGSGYTHPPTCTSGWPPTKPPTDAHAAHAAPDTRTASAPTGAPKILDLPDTSGSTDQPRTPPGGRYDSRNTHGLYEKFRGQRC